MNKIYRIVWNEARGVFMVAHEKSKANGKPSSTRKVVASAVVMALAAMAAEPAMAGAIGQTWSSGNANINNAGSIAGSYTGIRANNSTFTGSLTNSGTISGILSGIKLTYSTISGAIVNSDSISGSSYAILVDHSKLSGGISNSGTISSPYYDGIGVFTNSTLSGGITNSGTISVLNGTGIQVRYSATVAGGITNSGTISASSYGIGLWNAGLVSGGITNSSTISGYIGIAVDNSTITGGITNGGTISGSGTGAGIKVLSHGTVTGGITNSGTIAGGVKGIFLSSGTVSGGLTNSGIISGVTTGIKLTHSTISGGITNSGTITSSGAYGVWIKNSTVSSIINIVGGKIGATYSAIVISGGTVTGGITNSGTISGGTYAIDVVSGSLPSITIAGNNTAKFIGAVVAPNTPLTVASGAAYTMDNGNQFTVSGFTNNGTLGVAAGGTGTITGSYTQGSTGVYQENIGSITGISSGTYTGSFGQLHVVGSADLSGGYGVNVHLNSDTGITAGGTVVGVITATGGFTAPGLVTDNSALWAFTGTVSAGSLNLVTIVNPHDCGSSVTTSVTGPCYIGFDLPNISVASNGTISGGLTGIKVLSGNYTGSITNAGTISGRTGILVSPNTTLTGNITNSGTISGISDGVKLYTYATITGSIINQSGGTISGAYAPIYIADNSYLGGITNSGTILGTGYGIVIQSGSSVNSIVNNAGGLIHNASSSAIQVYHNASVGSIANSGTISGLLTGIKVALSSAVSGGLTNSGTISGGQYAVYVDSTSSLSGIAITGANTAKFGGDVFAQNTPVTITSGSTFTGTNAFNVQSFNIASTALFNMTAMPGVGTLTGAISNAGITTSQGVTNAGTISVADGVTGHITGNYTQASTGVYQLGASSNSSYGKLAVSGTANVAGTAYVNVNSVNSLASGQTLLGVLTSTGLTGNFASVGSSSNLFTFSSVVDGNNIDLSIAAAGASGGATVVTDTKANSNNPGMGAAVVFDNLIAQGGNAPAAMAPVITALGRMTTSQEVSNAVSQTLPLHTGGETPAITASLHSVNHIVQSRQEGEQGRSSGDGFIEDGKVWVKPFGSYANQGDYEGVNGFKAYTGGVVLGGDADVNSTHRVGVALAIASTNVSGNSSVAPQSSNVTTYQLALYGSHSLNDTTDVNFQADLGDHFNTGNRGIPFMGSAAQSSYRSLSEQLGVGIAHTMKLSDVTTFTPTARVDYTAVHNNGYTESGAGALDLIVDSSTVNEMIISTDGKFTHNLDEHSIVTANLGVGYDALNKQYTIVSAFAGDPTASFTTLGMNPSPWIARGGLGYVHTEKATEMMLRYDVDASTSHFVGQTVSARFRWSF